MDSAASQEKQAGSSEDRARETARKLRTRPKREVCEAGIVAERGRYPDSELAEHKYACTEFQRDAPRWLSG